MPLENLPFVPGQAGPMEGGTMPDEAETSTGADDIRTRKEQVEAMAPKEVHQLIIRWSDPLQVPNIATELDERELSDIGFRVIEEYQIDERSREGWIRMSREAMDLAMQVPKGRTGPWPGSSNVNYPLMAIAANQFAARAYPGIIADRNVVKGIVFGDDSGKPVIDPTSKQPAIGDDGQPVYAIRPGVLKERADRIGEHMSWQLLEEQPEWEPETDKLLHILPIVGSCARKTYFDPTEGRNRSVLVYPKNFVVNYWATSIYDAPRQTEILEVYPHQVEERKRAGIYIDQDYGPPEGKTNDPDAPYIFLEQHRRLDLDFDGYPEPYIVTVHKESGKVACIAARYDADGVLFSAASQQITKIIANEHYTLYEFLPNPEGGIYGVGFGQLLNPINDQINATLNMLFDGGHLQNSGAGFVGKGLSMHSGALKFKPGEFKTVNALGSTVRDAVVQLTFPGPSETLFKLLGLLVESAKDVASIKDVLTGDQMGANTPATTILALIEQGLKVFTAIFKRIHRCLKSEYDKLYRLNCIYLEEQSRYRVNNQTRWVTREDYVKGSGIEPVSDPKTVSDMQKLGRAEFLRQFLTDPFVEPLPIRRRIFEAAGIEKVDELLVKKPPENPEMIARAAEIELRTIEVKARSIKEMALAYKAMAEGDATAAQIGMDFVTHQMDMLRARVEALDEEQKNASAGAPDNGAGNRPRPLPSLVEASGDGGGHAAAFAGVRGAAAQKAS